MKPHSTVASLTYIPMIVEKDVKSIWKNSIWLERKKKKKSLQNQKLNFIKNKNKNNNSLGKKKKKHLESPN